MKVELCRMLEEKRSATLRLVSSVTFFSYVQGYAVMMLRGATMYITSHAIHVVWTIWRKVVQE